MVDERTTDAPISQVDLNYKAFIQLLPDIAAARAGKLALMHDGQIIDFFDTLGDAVRFGLEKFGEISKFSVQEVTSSVASLGFYSYAAGNVCEHASGAAC